MLRRRGCSLLLTFLAGKKLNSAAPAEMPRERTKLCVKTKYIWGLRFRKSRH